MSLTVKIRGDATHLEKVLRGVNSSVSGVGKSLASFTAAGAGFAAGLAGINGAAALTTKLFESIRQSSEKAAGIESLSVQFEVLAKSAEKSKELIESFRKEAVKSPLSVSDYANAGKTLMAFGLSADETLPVLKMLGDVSMGNAERFKSLALAFAQTQAAGRLMGQEVLQFVNAGFNPLQEISRKTGKSMADLKKEMEAGGISAKMVTEAFKSATSRGGLFFGAIEKGAATTEGKIAKVKDGIDQLQIAFGAGFNQGLKNALDATNNFLPQLESSLKSVGVIFGNAITDAVNGNFDIFLQAGVSIGKVIKEGLLMGVSDFSDSIFSKGDAGLPPNVFYDALNQLGFKKPTVQGKQARTGDQFIKDLKYIAAGESRAFQETVSKRDSDRMIEELIRNRKATEQLIEKGIKVTRDSLAQEILTFSR